MLVGKSKRLDPTAKPFVPAEYIVPEKDNKVIKKQKIYKIIH